METLEELDKLEHYKLIADEAELKWFYDHCVYPLKRNEAYAFCLASRHKKLTEEERQGTGLGRSEMMDPTVVFADAEGNTTYERWKKGIRAYECHKETFTTQQNKPYPAKTLVCYFHINPCDELKVIKDLKGYISTHEQELIDSAIKDIDRANQIANISNDLRSFLTDNKPSNEMIDNMTKRINALECKTNESGTSQSLYKMCKSLSKMKRLQFDNVGTKYWVDFDMDLNDTGKKYRDFLYSRWYEYCTEKLGKGNFVIVKTTGGYHTMVDKKIIHWNPDVFISNFTSISTGFDNTISDMIDELVYNTNAMIPVPGSFQYGNPVIITNKDDFEK